MKTYRWDGKRITKPGVYAGIPISMYHSQEICDGPSFSSSNLRRVLERNGGSPAHMYAEWTGNPKRIEPAEKAHHVIGQATHHLMLGEPNFEMSFAVRPPEFDSWRTTAAKDWRSKVQELGRTVLTEENLDVIRRMAESLQKTIFLPSDDPTARIRVCDLLSGHIERSFIWQDKETGYWLKARPDCIPTDSADFADLKTTSSVQYPDLMNAIRTYAYHQQAAMVAEGALNCGAEFDLFDFNFVFVFVEKPIPNCCRPIFVKPDDIARGMKQNRAALYMIERCMKEGYWPGPGANRAIEYVDLPDWYRDQADAEIAEIQRVADADRSAGGVPKRRRGRA